MSKKRTLLLLGIAAATVVFLASACTTSVNSEPIIASLESGTGEVGPLGSLQVVCTASDPDGDELSYEWSASGGEVSGDGDTATWTAPASEGSYSVAVVVTDGRGGEVMDYVAVIVRANNPPAIASLTADPGWTTSSGSVEVTCTASDPDADELTYEWTATAGSISGTGAVVSWTAPQEVGTYYVTVTVADGYGGSASDSLPISAVTGQPPSIEALLFTADHCYLKTSYLGYLVGKQQEYHVECIVEDTNLELFYDWSCTGGAISEISQDGSIITWIAPDEHVYVTITVTVSDIAGNMVDEGVFLEVVDCSYCTFGC